jgi:hypothetical protein
MFSALSEKAASICPRVITPRSSCEVQKSTPRTSPGRLSVLRYSNSMYCRLVSAPYVATNSGDPAKAVAIASSDMPEANCRVQKVRPPWSGRRLKAVR